MRLSPLHFTSGAAMNFSTSRSRAAKKLSKEEEEEKKKEEKKQRKVHILDLSEKMVYRSNVGVTLESPENQCPVLQGKLFLVFVSYRTQLFFHEARPTSLHFRCRHEFFTSRSRAANKLSKTMPVEKKKEKRFTSWIFRYLVYTRCKAVWKCSDEYRELNLMPDVTPGKNGVPEKRRSDPREP
ncbi:hypothetical protein CEXT_635871 [Caerostris extrusa]|uniref:Uncharacterized protein n=1 Tax=Caerostris extrusa TaxID=172846 RepID=A0AAV4XMF1_CAEEX|nr:hypothetical protein CEXT_635871 [Caerostris extrusa]